MAFSGKLPPEPVSLALPDGRPPSVRNPRSWLLISTLVATEALYLALLRFDANSGLAPVLTFLTALAALFFLYGVAWWSARGDGSHATLAWIWAGGVLFRLTLLPAGLPFGEDAGSKLALLGEDARGAHVTYERFLLYDSDIWRYLWDGHVAAAGVSPYRYAPSDPALDFLTDDDELWSDVRDNVNHPDVPTIYPPLSQMFFRLSHAIAPGSVVTMKALVTVFDLGAAGFLALALSALGRSPAGVLLYLWNPLVVKVFAGSGHVDSLLVLALVALTFFLAAGRKSGAAFVYGLSVLTKIAPVVLLPFVSRRLGWRQTALAISVVLLGYGVYAWDEGGRVLTGLFVFGRNWQFNAGPYALAASLFPDALARVLSGVALAVTIVLLARADDGRPSSFAKPAAAALGLLIVLGPTAMPWYVSWVLPLAILAGQRVWLIHSGLVCLAFHVMIDGEERSSVLALEYGALAFALLSESFHRTKGG